VLAGELVPEAGTVTRHPATASVVHVPQEPKVESGESLAAYLARRTGVAAAQARLDGATAVERGDVRLGPVDLAVHAGDRLRLTGPNGSGKSTLLDALLGRQPLLAGEAYTGPGVVVGELDQARRDLRGPEPLLEVFRRLSGLAGVDARTLLAKFRVGADVVLRPADTLSPGERTRVGLALFQARGSTCLVLDEPTNHLDLPAIEQLESALSTYDGTLLLVIHDRRLAGAVPVSRELDVRTLSR